MTTWVLYQLLTKNGPLLCYLCNVTRLSVWNINKNIHPLRLKIWAFLATVSKNTLEHLGALKNWNGDDNM